MGSAGAGWYKKEVAHRLLTKVVLIVLNFIKVKKIQKPTPSLALGQKLGNFSDEIRTTQLICF